MTFLDKMRFLFVKKQILSSKTDQHIKWELARELAHAQSDAFIADPLLVTFVYNGIKNNTTLDSSAGVLFEIFRQLPRKSIGQKNLMLTIRRMAIDGHTELSQQAVAILLERNNSKIVLGSKFFMEVLECIALFDEDGTVTRMLDDLEEKYPIETENSKIFKQARSNNIESLSKQGQENELDLTTFEEALDENENSDKNTENIDDFNGLSNLWARQVGLD